MFPIGYSKFLVGIHLFSHSDISVISIQYFGYTLAALYFFFTVAILYQPSKLIKTILLLFLFANPFCLYLANYISSDSIFLSFSLIWFSQLLRILARPRMTSIILHPIVLFLCFTTQNAGHYYPFISILAFLMANCKLWPKLTGIVTVAALILPYVLYTRHQSQELTGKAQLSFHTGWQIADNALMMRSHITPDSNKLPTTETRKLDRLLNSFFKYTQRKKTFDSFLSGYPGSFYIDDPRSPLQRFLSNYPSSPDIKSNTIALGKASKTFRQYGAWLIRHYPLSFVRYYVWPNLGNYLVPYAKDMQEYNDGKQNTILIVQDWFDYQTPMLASIAPMDLQSKLLRPVSYIFMMMQLLYGAFMISWLIKLKKRTLPFGLDRALLLSMGFSISNFLYSIFSKPVVLRDQAFSLLLTTTFCALLFEFLDKTEQPVNKVVNLSTNASLTLNNKLA